MANESMIKFLRGNVANLPQTATAGSLYFTKDEGIYLGLADGSYHRYGDFITVADVNALPATGAHATCMYYCTKQNILARYDSEKGWIQINKQPTAEEMKTLLSLGSLAYLSEVAESNLDAALAAKIHEHSFVESELNKIADGDVAKWAEAYAHSQVDHAPADAQANVIESVKVNGTALEIADKAVDITIPESTKVEASETNGNIKVDGEEVTVYTHPDKHAIADVTGLQDALDGKQAAGDYAAEEHTHVKADITDFDHTHVASDITDLDDTIKSYDYATNTYVGVIPETAEATNIIAYIQQKTAGIATDAALEELTGRVAGTENAITAINDQETGVLAQAKSYVDTEDVFHTDITTVNALGGIAAGADLNGMTTHEILNTLLFPYVAFVLGGTSRSAAAATLENGATQTLNSASISVTKKSKPITSVKLLNGSTVLGEKTGDAVAAGGTFTFSDLGITVSKSNNPNLTFTVTDGTTSTNKNIGASTFVYPYYTGECAADATIDEALVEGLTKKIESKGNKTVTHSCENGRMVIAYPKAHGVLKSILDPNNFETIGDYTRSEVSITGLDGTAQTYYVYASGAATVSGFKVQYKY